VSREIVHDHYLSGFQCRCQGVLYYVGVEDFLVGGASTAIGSPIPLRVIEAKRVVFLP
jgi:hypothetical protein